MNNFIRVWNERIAIARATGDSITIVNAMMDARDAFFEADDGSDTMNFYYQDVIMGFNV